MAPVPLFVVLSAWCHLLMGPFEVAEVERKAALGLGSPACLELFNVGRSSRRLVQNIVHLSPSIGRLIPFELVNRPLSTQMLVVVKRSSGDAEEQRDGAGVRITTAIALILCGFRLIPSASLCPRFPLLLNCPAGCWSE